MRTRRVRGKALLVTVTALALAVGCSSGGGAAASSGLEKPDLNVAVVPSLDSAGFFVALYQGLFKAQGLNVNFTPVTSDDTMISDQVNGVYDITGGNYVSYIQAQQSGEANLDIFAEGSVMEPGAQGIYTTPDSPVRTIADLKNQLVAIDAPKDILYLLASSVLAEHGVCPRLGAIRQRPVRRYARRAGVRCRQRGRDAGTVRQRRGTGPKAASRWSTWTRARPRASRSRATW